MKKIILLTGASGFIGRNIMESDLTDKYLILAPNSKKLNLLDQQSVKDFFDANNVDVVIHAAVKRCDRYSYDKEGVLEENLKMFFNLEFHKNKYEKFLHLGSGAVYDKKQNLVKVRESLQHTPHDLYGFSKYVIAKYIENIPNFYDLRLFGIFGKYEDYNLRLISNLICLAIFKQNLIIQQNKAFDYLYVDDFLKIIEFFIENKPKEKAYNLTPDHSISLLEIAEKIQKITQGEVSVDLINKTPGTDYTGDNERLKKIIPNLQFTPIDTAIQHLWLWYENNKENIRLNTVNFTK